MHQELRRYLTISLKTHLWMCLAIMILIYGWLFAKVLGSHAPLWNDEPCYFVNAASFYQNNRLSSALMIDDFASPIGKFDPHGFLYPLFHGLIAKLVGFHQLNLVATNLILLMLCMVVMRKAGLSWNRSAVVMTVILSYFVSLMFGFSDMQENIHVFFGVCIGGILWQLDRHRDDPRQRRRLVLFYIATIVIFALFRPLWIVWLVALAPFIRSWREAAAFAALNLVAAVLTVIYMGKFCAPYPYGFLAKMFTHIHDLGPMAGIRDITHNVFLNLQMYFLAPLSPAPSHYILPGWDLHRILAWLLPFIRGPQGFNYYYWMKPLYLLVALFLFGYGLLRRSRVPLAVGLCSLINIILLIMVYDATQYREHRALGAAFTLGVLVLVLIDARKTVAVIVIFMLALFPASLGRELHEISLRQQLQKNLGGAVKEMSPLLQEAGRLVDTPGLSTVLLTGTSSFCREPLVIYNLALRSGKGHPIRYGQSPACEPPVPYIRRMTPKIDYILNFKANPNETLAADECVRGMPLLLNNKYFEFYKTNRPPVD